MPYLDATSPALYLSTRLGRSRRRLGDTGVAFQPPHIFTAAQTGKAVAPATTAKPIGIPTFPVIPGAPRVTINWPAGTPKPTVPAPPVGVAPPPGGSPQGQIPNGPSNIPIPTMTDSGGGPVMLPGSPGGMTDAGALPSGMETAGGGSGGGGVSLFASLPWWAWLALGVAGYYVARRVTA